MSKVNITESQITILFEVDGQVCVTQMDNEKLEAVSLIAKKSVERLIKTGVTQDELNRFLLPSFFKE